MGAPGTDVEFPFGYDPVAKTDGEQTEGEAPPLKKGGYNRQKFQEGWGNFGDHSAEGLKKFMADNQDFTEGVTFQQGAGGTSKDKVITPGYTEEGTNIFRGPEYLDLIRDVGGANQWGWGGAGDPNARNAPPSPPSAVPPPYTPGGRGMPPPAPKEWVSDNDPDNKDRINQTFDRGLPSQNRNIPTPGMPGAETRSGGVGAGASALPPLVQTPPQGPAAPRTEQGIKTDTSPLSQFLMQQLTQTNQGNAERDALRGQIKGKADEYGKAVTADDPIIKAQTDAYHGKAARSLADSRETMAERAHAQGVGTGAFDSQLLNAEMASGRDESGFQAGLMSTELQSRRQALSDMLDKNRGLLSDQDQADIQQKIATIDGTLRLQGTSLQDKLGTADANRGSGALDLQDKLGSGAMGLQGKSLDLQGLLGMKGLDIQKMLGLEGLDLQDKLGTADVGLKNKGLDITDKLGSGNLELGDKLGTGGLNLQNKGLDINDRNTNRGFDIGDQTANRGMDINDRNTNRGMDIQELLGRLGLGNQSRGLDIQSRGQDNQNNQFYDQFAYGQSRDANSLDSQLLQLLLGGG